MHYWVKHAPQKKQTEKRKTERVAKDADKYSTVHFNTMTFSHPFLITVIAVNR